MNSIISKLLLVLLLTAGLMFSAGSSQAAPAPMLAPVTPAAQTVAECLASCHAQFTLDVAACKSTCWECDLWILGVCVSGSLNIGCQADCQEDADEAFSTCTKGCKDLDPQSQG